MQLWILITIRKLLSNATNAIFEVYPSIQRMLYEINLPFSPSTNNYEKLYHFSNVFDNDLIWITIDIFSLWVLSNVLNFSLDLCIPSSNSWTDYGNTSNKQWKWDSHYHFVTLWSFLVLLDTYFFWIYVIYSYCKLTCLQN